MTTPPAGTAIEVVGTWLKSDGSPEAGHIRIRPMLNASSYGPTPRRVTMGVVDLVLDGSGSIRTSLVPSDDPDWMLASQLPYKVNVDLLGSQESYYVYITGPGPVDLPMIDHLTRAQIQVPVPISQALAAARARSRV